MPSPSTPPGDFGSLVALLRTRGPTLPKRLRQVAEHMLAHPDDMAFQTTAQIAGEAGVQPSTLVRFAQALDYAGFSDLQQVFRARLRQQTSDHRARVAALRSGRQGEAGMTRALLDGFVQASQASLDALQGRVRVDDIDAATDRLARAQTLFLVGARRMFPVVSYLAYAFGKLGIRAILVDHVGGLGAEQAAIATPVDAVIAVSCAPYTPQTVEIAAQAHRNGVPVIALTDGALSPLATQCLHWIEISEADFGAFRSMAASFALAMTLAVATAEKIRADA